MRTFEAKKSIEDAVRTLFDDHSMGYLAVTCKPELPVRDKVAWHFHKRHPHLVVAREHTVNSEKDHNLKKKVDLALLDSSCKPVVLVEFKAMIVPDPLGNPEHKNMTSLVHDLQRLSAVCSVSKIGVMLMVDAENCAQRGPYDCAVKYMRDFRRHEKDPNRIEKAIENASKFFDKAHLNVTSLRVELGFVWDAGVNVKLICFILEPNNESGSGL